MNPDRLVRMSAEEMAAAVRARVVSARTLLEAHLERIERFDGALGAFRLVLAESARAEADRIDADLASLSDRPLLGVPVAIKDTMDVRGVPSRLGTASAEPPAIRDSEVVRRLRTAGAVIVGKTNLPELAAWPFTSASTWGRTAHPWNAALDPGGSSGGSAVAVASRMCALALGDDLGGSIRVPAANTGLFGIKPQTGRVSMLPHTERIEGLGAYGPLARTVRDAGIALDVLSASGSFARASCRAPARLRVGVSIDTPIGVAISETARAALDDGALLLARLGHDVRPVKPAFGRLLPVAFFARYFAGLAAEYRALSDPRATESRTRFLAGLGRHVPRAALSWARTEGRRQWSRLAPLFDEIDVLMTPVLTGPPAASAIWQDRGLVSTLWAVAQHSPYSALANMTGQPACALPLGLDDTGLPVAIQLLGRPDDEETLLSLAAEVEQARAFPVIDDRRLEVFAGISARVPANRGGPGDRRRHDAEHGDERA